MLSGPLNQLNATLSLLHPSAIGSVIGKRYLTLSRIHTQVGVHNRLILNHLTSSTPRLWRYSV